MEGIDIEGWWRSGEGVLIEELIYASKRGIDSSLGEGRR